MIQLCERHAQEYTGTSKTTINTNGFCEQCRINESLNEDHDAFAREELNKPTWEKKCENCSRTIERYYGEVHVSCACGALYNAAGNRLRDDALGNPSMYDDDISDLDGYEMQHAYDDY